MMNQLLIAQPPIQIMPALAEAVGLNEAAVLQVTHYWLTPLVNQHFKDGSYWVQNLVAHLQGRFTFWDEDAIGYMVAQFEQSEVLTVRHETTSDGVPITYHTINYDRLEQMSPAPDAPFIPDAPMERANSNIRPAFRVEVHEKANNLYIMAVEDMRHFLACDLTLEIQEKTGDGKSSDATQETILRKVLCHFPRIADKEFRKFVWDDATLYRILLDAFHLRIMKQLLSFCLDHYATHLTIFADDTQAADLEVYRMFLSYSSQTPTARGEGTGVVIPTYQEAFDRWMEFMGKADTKLQQNLWRNRKDNPAIQNYLKYHDWPEI